MRAIAVSTENDHCDVEFRKILLKRQVAIDRNGNAKLFCSQREKLAVFHGGLTHLRNSPDFMTDYILSDPTINASVEENSHEAAATIRSFASSKKATTWSRVTVGKPSRKLSIVSPPSSYLRSACTRTRVPAYTGVTPITSDEQVTIGSSILQSVFSIRGRNQG
jgi:hypothetical protein